MKGFLSVVGESIDERESSKFKEGLDSKVKLSLYRTFCKAVEFKACLHGECDAGSRLMFRFRSGIILVVVVNFGKVWSVSHCGQFWSNFGRSGHFLISLVPICTPWSVMVRWRDWRERNWLFGSSWFLTDTSLTPVAGREGEERGREMVERWRERERKKIQMTLREEIFN